MAISKQAVTILAPTNVPAGTSAASPVVGAAIDVRAFAGGEWGYRITNVGTPGAACTITLQTSTDGADWVDSYVTSGNTVASGSVSGSFTMSRGVMYARVAAYGITLSAATVSSSLQAVVG